MEGVLDRRVSQGDRRLDRWLRAAVLARLRRVRHGAIRWLEDGVELERLGDPATQLEATVRVRDPAFYRAVVLRGSLGAAESYMDGDWECDDLTSLVRILARDREALGELDGGVARWARAALRVLHETRRNSRRGSRRNIAAHYDLGNEFFSLFLDPTLTYSSGVFERPDMSMEEASIAKLDRVCRALELGPDDHVLEIGTGWGSFALHAAGRHGCRVTTTTLSRQQHALARERVAAAGLADRVEVRLDDYRDLRGTYDKLVSIEMIEAVGHRNLGRFFRVCSERLRPEGAMWLQAITVPDPRFETSKRNVEFIKRYIFPGGQLVSVGAIGAAIAAGTDLRITRLEDVSHHYAETLRRWHGRMRENLPEMRALGLPERFLRMWEYYLCYCAGGFHERAIGVAQVLLEKPRSRREDVGRR